MPFKVSSSLICVDSPSSHTLNGVEAETPLTQEAVPPARMDNTNVKRLTPFWIRGRLVLSDMSDGPIVMEDGEILATLAEVRQYKMVKSHAG